MTEGIHQFNLSAKAGNTNMGFTVGHKYEKNGTFIKSEIGVGSSAEAQLKFGHTIDLNKNLSLELAGKGEISRALTKNSGYSISTNVGDTNERFSYSLNNGYVKAGAGAELNFKGKNFKLGAGVETGYYDNLNRNIHVELKTNDTSIIHDVNTRKAKLYVSPTVSAEYNVNKNLSVVANADIHKQNIGVSWTF